MSGATRRDQNEARFLFFGGKGGVGKTTCAAGAALRMAERGHDVLVASTDPAHSLGDSLRMPLADEARRVRTRRGRLDAVELDADGALAEWLDERTPTFRVIADRGTYLDEEDVDQLFRLSLPGVDELVGLVHLLRLSEARPYDLVVVDMAPTGHALRMLEMPEMLGRLAGVLDDMQAKHRYMAEALGGRRRADRADGLIDELRGQAASLHELLRNPDRCAFTWVLAAEALALAEARRGICDLRERGIDIAELVVNRWSGSHPSNVETGVDCPACTARARAEAQALARIQRELDVPVIRLVAELDREPRGTTALRTVGRQLALEVELPPPPRKTRDSRSRARPRRPAAPWAARLAPPERKLLVMAGKGGVGKTTCAAAVALVVATLEQDRRVLLLSADPAHSLSDVLGLAAGDEARPLPGGPPSLRVRELDSYRALEETRSTYHREVEALFDRFFKGSRFDATLDRAVMQDFIELTPPGMDELFAVLAVVDALDGEGGGNGDADPEVDLVVLDAAPTGHALRLLAMPELVQQWIHAILRTLLKYRDALGLGDAAAHLLERARAVRSLVELLHDPARCSVVAVTRPAELPRLETERLLDALGELGVGLGAVIVNAATRGDCARCRRTAAREQRTVSSLAAACTSIRDEPWGLIEAPMSHPPPVGPADLCRWAATWKEARP